MASRLLLDQHRVDVVLVQLAPGAGGGVDDHRHQAQDDVQDDPAGADLVADVVDPGLVAFGPEFDGILLFALQLELQGRLAHQNAVDVHVGLHRRGLHVDALGVALEQRGAAGHEQEGNNACAGDGSFHLVLRWLKRV
jgi:hypothetical protein